MLGGGFRHEHRDHEGGYPPRSLLEQDGMLCEQGLDPADPGPVDAAATLGDDLRRGRVRPRERGRCQREVDVPVGTAGFLRVEVCGWIRSEEHTSELQSLAYLVCRLLL